MRVSHLKNISDKPVVVRMGETAIRLMPGSEIHNAEVQNLDEIRSQVSVTEDLTEVKPATGMQRLDG